MENKNNVIEMPNKSNANAPAPRRRITITLRDDDAVKIDVYRIESVGEILGLLMGSVGVVVRESEIPFDKMNNIFSALLSEWYPDAESDKHPDVTVEALELACDVAMMKKAEGIEDLAERQAAVVEELKRLRQEYVDKTGYDPTKSIEETEQHD